MDYLSSLQVEVDKCFDQIRAHKEKLADTATPLKKFEILDMIRDLNTEIKAFQRLQNKWNGMGDNSGTF